MSAMQATDELLRKTLSCIMRISGRKRMISDLVNGNEHCIVRTSKLTMACGLCSGTSPI